MSSLSNIEANNWSNIKITKQIISSPIHRQTYIIEYAILSNNIDIIEKILKIDKNNYKKISTNTLVTLCKSYNFNVILQFFDLLTMANVKYLLNQTKTDWFLLYYFKYASQTMIKKILKYKKEIPFATIINDYSILRIYLTDVYSNNHNTDTLDEILKLSKSLINKNKYIINPIIQCCLKGFNKEILDKIIKMYPELLYNYDENMITPLIAAISINNDLLAEYIITRMNDGKKNSDITFNYFGTTSAILTALHMRNNKIITKLLSCKDIDVNSHNIQKWLPAHLMFIPNSNVSINNKKIILDKTTNINSRNLNGNTVLHLLCLNNSLKTFQSILEKKVLDLFVRNLVNKTPIHFCHDPRLLLKIASKSFINNLDKIEYQGKKLKKIKNKKEILLETEKCLKKKMDKVLDNSYKYSDNNDVNFIMEENVDYSLFTASDHDSLIYLLYFIRNYDVNIPIDKSNDKYQIIKKSNNAEISEIFDIYLQPYFDNKKLQNYNILWYDINNYCYSANLEKILPEISGITFIYVTIINLEFDHANGMIIDSNKKSIIHFEPYGILDTKKINDFDNMFKKYFKKVLPKYTYYSPKDYMKVNSFQHLSNETNKYNIKIGDIGGFCLAWTLWFLELYLKNQNKSLDSLIQNAIDKIINTKFLFSEYIRSYANKLTNYKTSILNEINYPANKLFNMYKSHSEVTGIFNSINKLI